MRKRLEMMLALVLVLLMPILTACGNGNDKSDSGALGPASTAEPTTTATAIPTPTPNQPVSTEPIKIGAITSWNGPSAAAGYLAEQIMGLVKDQVEMQGGILGGRPVEFIKCDENGQVADLQACWTKLVEKDHVSAIVFGGGVSATIDASSDLAEEFKVPFFTLSPFPPDLTDRPYTVRCTYSKSAQVGTVPDFVVKELKPKKIALLCEDEETMRAQLGIMKEQIQSAGVEIVYQEYVPYGTTDLSPYITNIKHKNPDVLIGYFSQENVYTTLFKQIMEQGGWGSIKFVSGSPASTSGTAVRQAGAEGTYHWALWIPGFSNPASQKFEQDFREKYGKAPAVHHANFYLPLWGAIHAIELADSDDPQEIAQAARSGNLHWDTPAGPITILPNGETDLAGSMMVVENGALVPVATLTAASTATPTENHPTPTPTAALTINSTIGELYDNQDANKILRECLGDAVVDNPQFSMGFGFDLPTLVPMSGGKFTDAMVTCLDEGLKALAAGQKPTPTPTP